VWHILLIALLRVHMLVFLLSSAHIPTRVGELLAPGMWGSKSKVGSDEQEKTGSPKTSLVGYARG